MWPFTKKGSARINSTVGMLDKAIKDLYVGIEENLEIIDDNYTTIDNLKADIEQRQNDNESARALAVKLSGLKG